MSGVFLYGELPPAPAPPPARACKEQSTGIELGLLAPEDESVASPDILSTNCVGSKAKQERKPTDRETILAALTLWLARLPSAGNTSLLLPLPGVPPSDPSPCSDMPQFHLYCRNTSHLLGWIQKNAAREQEPVCSNWSQHSRASTSSRRVPHLDPGSAQPGPEPLERDRKGLKRPGQCRGRGARRR